jgi:hypothetical protein
VSSSLECAENFSSNERLLLEILDLEKNNYLHPRSRSTVRFQQENTGNQWKHGSSIPAGKSSDFFHCLLVSFPFFWPGNARKSAEKIRNFFGWNTASMFHHFSEVFCRIQSLFRLFPLGPSEISVIS